MKVSYQENVWVDAEGNPMTWKTNWAPKEPKNKTKDQDCGIMKSKTGVIDNKFAALQCSASAHPVCQFESRVRLELRGICKTDELDTQYTVYNSTHLLGDSHNWIRDNREVQVKLLY